MGAEIRSFSFSVVIPKSEHREPDSDADVIADAVSEHVHDAAQAFVDAHPEWFGPNGSVC